MLFSIDIQVSVPADLPQGRKDELRRAETVRAMELMKEGKLRRIWRVVGEVAGVSLWEADTLEELHAAVGSLPMYPYLKVKVTPLIEHPSMAAWKATHGDLPPF